MNIEAKLKDLGVTQARWTTMVYLKEGGEGLTQRELAGLMAIENPTLVRLLDSQEQQHLIERRACPNDRRARRLHLTDPGREFMEVLSARVNALRDEMLDGISENEIESALKVFHKILDNAEKQK